jgi:hypothetical protein
MQSTFSSKNGGPNFFSDARRATGDRNGAACDVRRTIGIAVLHTIFSVAHNEYLLGLLVSVPSCRFAVPAARAPLAIDLHGAFVRWPRWL